MYEALRNHSMLGVGQEKTPEQEIAHIASQWMATGTVDEQTAQELARAEVLAPNGDVPLLKVEAL